MRTLNRKRNDYYLLDDEPIKTTLVIIFSSIYTSNKISKKFEFSSMNDITFNIIISITIHGERNFFSPKINIKKEVKSLHPK